jgi:hypothetical protein
LFQKMRSEQGGELNGRPEIRLDLIFTSQEILSSRPEINLPLDPRVVDENVDARKVSRRPVEEGLPPSAVSHIAWKNVDRGYPTLRLVQFFNPSAADQHNVVRFGKRFRQSESNARAAARDQDGVPCDLHVFLQTSVRITAKPE